MSDQNAFGFIGFEFNENDFFHTFVVFRKSEDLDRWKHGEESPSDNREEPASKDDSSPAADELSDRVEEILNRFVKAMSSVRSMIAFTSMIAPAFRYMIVNGKLAPHAKKNLSVVFNEGSKIAFSFTRDQFPALSNILIELEEAVEGQDRLPEAILLGLVSIFDQHFSDIIRMFLSIHPERYTESDRQISMKEIFSMGSLREVIDHVIDGEIVDLMRGNHTEQVRFAESTLGIKIIEHYERWPNFVEIFERRNLVAHGNLTVNNIYMTKLRSVKFKSPPEIGTRLELSQKYLNNAVNVLTEFNLLLGFTLWRKHVDNSDADAFSFMNQVCYDLILRNRTRLAKHLLDFLINKQSRKGCSDLLYRMMVINFANCHKILKDEDGYKKVLASVDWTAAIDKFRICIAALHEDVERVVHLMPTLAGANGISAHEFREWPVLQWVRKDERVVAKFHELYGEAIAPEVSTRDADGRAQTLLSAVDSSDENENTESAEAK